MDNIYKSLKELQHAGKWLAALASLRRDAALCDVLLKAESMTNEAVVEANGVMAHRAILAAASPYFYEMFYSSFEEYSKQVVVLEGIKLDILQALIENIYTPKPLVMTVEKAKGMLAAATKLVVPDVRDEACTCLERKLAIDNALGIHASAEQHNCTTLATTAQNYIHNHFQFVLRTDEFMALSAESLIKLLRTDRCATIEEYVLDSVLRWTQNRLQGLRQHLVSMLGYVQLPLVPRSVLVERARAEPLASSPPALIQIIGAMESHHIQQHDTHSRVMGKYDRQSRVMEQHVMEPHIQKREIQSRVTHPPDVHSPVTRLLVIGGGTSENLSYSNTVLTCYLPGDRWQFAGVLPAPRVLAGAALLDRHVYVVGGAAGGAAGPNTTRTVFVYDVTTGSWSPGPPMNTARWWLDVAVLSRQLYAVGGRNGFNTINTAEALDPREGIWRPIANMITHRGGHGVAALQGRLYAVGGHDGNMALNSTERYDQLAGKWEAVEAMEEQRMAVGVTVVGDAIYAVGGSSGTTLRSVEFYRAGLGWEPATPMAIQRRGAAVTSHDGRLYVAGGTDDPNLISSVCMLDVATDMWSELPALPTGRWGAAAVVVSWPPPPAS